MSLNELLMVAPLLFGAGDFETFEHPMFLFKVRMHAPQQVELLKYFPNSAFSHSEDDGPEFNSGKGTGALIFDIEKYKTSLDIPTVVTRKNNKIHHAFSNPELLRQMREGYKIPLPVSLGGFGANDAASDGIDLETDPSDMKYYTFVDKASGSTFNEAYFMGFAPSVKEGKAIWSSIDSADKEFVKKFYSESYLVQPVTISMYLNNPKLGRNEEPLDSIKGWCFGLGKFSLNIDKGELFTCARSSQEVAPTQLVVSQVKMQGTSNDDSLGAFFEMEADPFIENVILSRLKDLAKDSIKAIKCVDMKEGDKRLEKNGGCFYKEVDDGKGGKISKAFLRGTIRTSTTADNSFSFRVLDSDRKTDKYRIEVSFAPVKDFFEPVLVRQDLAEEKK